MTRLRSTLGICIALGASLLANGAVLAAAPQADLAAMALAPEDVPAGTFDEYYEWLVPGDAVGEFLLDGAPAPAGLERAYQSFYSDPEQGSGIQVYLFDFATPEQALSGAGVADAILRPPLPEGVTVGPTHASITDADGASRTTTTARFDTWPSGGPRVDVVATSFQRDDLVGGISVERWTDPPAELSEADVTPIDPDGQQQQLSAALAATLEDRVAQVLAGTAPSGVDLSLPDRVLPIDTLGNGGPVFEGYKSGPDLLRCGICGEQNSLVRFADAAHGGYMRMAVVGPPVGGDATPPFVTVVVSAFATPEDALGVLAATRLAPDDRPTAGPVPRGRRLLVDDPTIPGADAALAFVANMDGDDPTTRADSAGVDLIVGDHLVTIDVQGGLDGQEALAVAVDLASQQTACLGSSEPCELVVPPTLATLTAGS